MIAVAMDAWRSNGQGEPLEELERSERESRGTLRCGMGETIDDAFASGRTDGDRVLAVQSESAFGAQPLILVLNWFEELRQRMGN